MDFFQFLAALAISSGIVALIWYDSLTSAEKAEVNAFAKKQFGKVFHRLTATEQQQVFEIL